MHVDRDTVDPEVHGLHDVAADELADLVEERMGVVDRGDDLSCAVYGRGVDEDVHVGARSFAVSPVPASFRGDSLDRRDLDVDHGERVPRTTVRVRRNRS